MTNSLIIRHIIDTTPHATISIFIMIRILQVVAHLKRNGTETFIMNLFRNIDRKKIMFDFLTFDTSKGGFYDDILSLGGQVFTVPSRRDGFIKYHKALDVFFRHHAQEYNGVHLHMSCFSTIAPLIYAKKYGIALRIFHSHSVDATGIHNKILHYINRLRIKHIGTHFLACSEQSRLWGYNNSGVLHDSRVVTNGIDISRYNYNEEIRTVVRKSLNLSNKFVIGHVGTFNTIKNQSFIIDVFKEIINKEPNSILMLVGEGPLFQHVKSKADNYGLSSSTLFLGRRNDVPHLLQAIDVMVMPSFHEGLPFSLIEAQASGLPVIASDTIPDTAKASDFYHSLSLNRKHTEWADNILKYKNFQRRKTVASDSIYRFSIEHAVNEIESIYFSLNENRH